LVWYLYISILWQEYKKCDKWQGNDKQHSFSQVGLESILKCNQCCHAYNHFFYITNEAMNCMEKHDYEDKYIQNIVYIIETPKDCQKNKWITISIEELHYTCALSKELKFKVSFSQNLKTFFYCQWRSIALQNMWKCVIALCVVIQLWVYFGIFLFPSKK
jgi:hypothetical protein